jgi:hypothetical protein
MKVYLVKLYVDQRMGPGATVHDSWICKSKEEAESVKFSQMIHLLDYFDIDAQPDDKDLEEKIEDHDFGWGITYYNRDLDCFPYLTISEEEI